MKLTGVELRRVSMPLVSPFRTSFGTQTVRELMLLRIVTDEAEGWGECVAEATPGGLNHPEYYYGFLGSALVMQLVYLATGRDPVRFRPLMPIAALAKAAFFATILILWLQERVPAPALEFASVDALLAFAFLHAWRVTPAREPGSAAT